METISSPDEKCFFVDFDSGPKPIPTFAFRFMRPMPWAETLLRVNRRILLMANPSSTSELRVIGGHGVLTPESAEVLSRFRGAELETQMLLNTRSTIELNYVLIPIEFVLFAEVWHTALRWALVTAFPNTAFRTSIRVSNGEVEATRLLHWHEVPRF